MMQVPVLVDVGVGTSVEDWFRKQGHDTRAVRDRDPDMTDAEVFNWAVAEQRLVVTMHKDFGALIYHSAQPHAGVLLLPLEGADAEEKIRVIDKVFKKHGEELANHYAVFQKGRLRIRSGGKKA